MCGRFSRPTKWYIGLFLGELTRMKVFPTPHPCPTASDMDTMDTGLGIKITEQSYDSLFLGPERRANKLALFGQVTDYL